jgi:hypothetical protein
VQGLRAGARFAKIITFFIMQRITSTHIGVSHRLWIDDLSQVDRGSRRAVVYHLSACLITTFEQMEEHGLTIATKSVAVCSKLADARAIV